MTQPLSGCIFVKTRAMKSIIKALIFLGILAVVFNSCAPLYVPNVINTPGLKEKGDFNTSVHVGTSGYDLQGAYAITDNIGVMINGSYLNHTADSSDDYHKHIFVEAGAGYYKPIGKYFLFDVYGGYGIGKINSYQSVDIFESFADTYVNRVFIQPSFGFFSPYFEIAIAPRTVIALVSQPTGRQTGFFIEPTVILKTGSSNIKVTSQLGLSFMLNEYYNSFLYQPFIFSIGLQYSFRSFGSERKF